MKTKLIIAIALILLPMGIISFLLSIYPATASTYEVNTFGSWTDDFSGTTINPRWSWIREDPTHWSLTAHPGYLRLITKGGLHQTGNDLKNLLITPVYAQSFQITTRVTVTPTENYQSASLMVYQDDDNYFEVSRVYNNGDKVRIKKEVAGATSSSYTDVPTGPV